MKNALLIVNALLVIAVGFLMYKQFKGNTSTGSSVRASDMLANRKDSLLGKKVLFAYIDMDSVQEHYELAKNVQNEIKKKQDVMNTEVERMEKSLKAKFNGYQQKAQTMTEAETNNARQDIENSQAQLAERKQNLTEEYNQFVSNKVMNVKKKIEDYLKIFNADRTFSFIFSYEPGLFYYKDTTYDITGPVLKGLNEQYANERQ